MKRRVRRRRLKSSHVSVSLRGYFTIEELMLYLNVSKNSIKYWTGKIAGGIRKLEGFPERIITGGDFRWKIYDIQEWLGYLKKNRKGEMVIKSEREMLFPDRLLSTESAARYLDMSEQHVRFLARQGVIRASKAGRLWKFRIEDLRKYANIEA